MASRTFLKILQSARSGDVSAQQNLARVYFTGAFNTPIQPANSLLWLEKSYYSIINQYVTEISSETIFRNEIHDSLLPIFNQLISIPLATTFGSPAFPFGWNLIWKLASDSSAAETSSIPILKPSTASPMVMEARWQLIQFLISPENVDLQERLKEWLLSCRADTFEFVPASDFFSLQEICKSYLASLAATDNQFTQSAKELLLRFQPKNEALIGLWAKWLTTRERHDLLAAAEMGLTIARLTLGLQLAHINNLPLSKSSVDSIVMSIHGSSISSSLVAGSNSDNSQDARSNASLKKAVYWLELAAKDGDRDAWLALGKIYRRPQFSGYNAAESDRCFDRAADLGHAEAQYLKAANLWRKREKLSEKVKGLQASYWAWQAHQQGIGAASTLLNKILLRCPDPTLNQWHEFAQRAEQAINRHAEYKIDAEWIWMCHRLVVANQFNFSKAELLLADIELMQHEHCVVADIRWELPKILPRLILIETIGQRRSILAAGKVFAESNGDESYSNMPPLYGLALSPSADESKSIEGRKREGNLRQRRYRFNAVTRWLLDTFCLSENAQTN